MGAKTLLHMATLPSDRIEAMVLVSATPYVPAQARAAMAELSGPFVEMALAHLTQRM